MSIDMYGKERPPIRTGRTPPAWPLPPTGSHGEPRQAPPSPSPGSSDGKLAVGCLVACLIFVLIAAGFVSIARGRFAALDVLALLGLAAGLVWLIIRVSRRASSPAREPGATHPPGNAQAGAGDLLERLERLEREAADLRAIVSQYLAASSSADVQAPGEKELPPPATVIPPEAIAAPFPAAQLSGRRGPVGEAPGARARTGGRSGFWRSLAGPLADSKAGKTAPSGAAVAEARIGTVWFSRVGVLLLIVGALLGYRYGVTNDLLRVLTGYVAGLGLLALGFWGQRRHYRVWALAVTGGGLGVLYLTTIAANMFFQPAVIPDSVTFGLMVLVTVFGTGLAILYDSPVIGILGMIGGFAASVPLATGPYDYRLLFVYVAILDAGLLLVAYFRRWLLYNFLLFAATWGIYGLWRLGMADYPLALASRAGGAFAFITLFFLIFAAVTVTSSLTRRGRVRGTPAQDLVLVVVNAFVYFGAGLDLLRSAGSLAGGLFALALAALHLCLGYLVWAKRRDDRSLVLGQLGLAVVFLTVTFPVALDGSWITVAWAVEGAVLVWLGFLTGARQARWGGLVVLGLAAVRLCIWETFPAAFGAPLPGPALRALPFLASVAAFYLAAAAYARFKERRSALGTLVVAANVFTLWYLTREVCLHFGQAWYATSAGAGSGAGGLGLAAPVVGLILLTLSCVWGLYGLALSLADLILRRAAVRTGARLVLGMALAFLFLGGFGTAGQDVAATTRWLALGGSLGSVWVAELVFRRRGLDSRVNGALSLAATALGFGAVALETMRFLAPYLTPALGQLPSWPLYLWQHSVRGFVLAAAWGLYALLVTGAGALLRSTGAKAAAAAYFLVALALAAFQGVPSPAAPVALRAAAFAILVPGVYLAAYIAARGGRSSATAPVPRPRAEVVAWVATALAAAILTAWWGVAEIGGLSFKEAWGPGSPGLATATWLGFYALAVGLVGRWLRSSPARWLAIGLHGLALAGLLLVVAFTQSLWATPAWWPFSGVAFVGVVLGLYAANALYRSPDSPPAQAQAVGGLSLVACAFTVVWLAIEAHSRFAPAGQVPAEMWLALQSTANHWVILLTGVYGLAVTAVGIRLRSPSTRVVGLSIQAVASVGVLTIGLLNPAAPHFLRLAALAGALGGLYTSAWLVRRFAARTTPLDRRATEWLSLAAAAATVAWLTVQAQQYFAPFIAAGTMLEREFALSTLDFSVSAVWAAYGFLVLVVGFVVRHRLTRLLGLGVLGLTLGKIGVSDMWHLAVRWRILITIGLGVVFLVASFIYQRFSRVILDPEPEKAPRAKGRKAKGAGSAGLLIIAILVGTATLALPAGSALAAVDVAEWKYARSIGEVAAGWVAIDLDGPVLTGARSDLADLRVVDEARNELPWSEVSRAGPAAESFEVRVFDLFTDEKAARTTFVADLGRSGVVTNRIVLRTTSRDFLKRLTFEASDDLVVWNALPGEDYVYDLTSKEGGARFDARYPGTSRRYLRVTIDDLGTPPLQGLGAGLERRPQSPVPRAQVPVSVVGRGQEGGDTWTVVDVGYAGVPVTEVGLATSATYFSRPLLLEGSDDRAGWRVVARGAFYRQGPEETSGLTATFPEATFRFYRLTIMNGDNPAIAPESLTLAGGPRRIVFRSPGGRPLSCLYGNPKARAPVYDPAQFTDPGVAQASLANLGPQVEVLTEPETAPTTEQPQRSRVGPPLWRYERSLDLPAAEAGGSGGFVAVTLDRWVIGAARPDLGDLRLVDDLGFDLPYQVNDGLTAATTWTFAVANTGKEASLCWWVLDLGAPNTPSGFVCFESLSSSATRSVTVSGSNDGQVWWLVGQGSVRRAQTIFGLEENLVVAYPVAHSRYLRLAVEGQDVLFRPKEVKGFMSAIVFRPQEARTYRLVYGNSAATTPPNDPALFADAYAPALLGPETMGPAIDHSPSPDRPSFLVPGEKDPTPRSAAGWAEYGLWIVLGLAVPLLGYLAFVVFRKVMAKEAAQGSR